MNRPANKTPVESKFFGTLNYVELGADRLLEDFHKLQDEADVLCGPEGRLNALCCWEERGLDTGNPHMHMIIILKREHRTRSAALASQLVDVLGLQVRPHIEPLKDLRGAIQYRDKPSKAEAWEKWTDKSRAPAFFVLIHAGSLRREHRGAYRVLGSILGELWQKLPITKRLF